MANLSVQQVDGGIVFEIKVIPGSSKTAVSGLLGEKIKIKISAAAEKGKANKCLIELLSKQLGVKKNAIRIISGQTSPVKQVQVQGLDTETLLKKMNLK